MSLTDWGAYSVLAILVIDIILIIVTLVWVERMRTTHPFPQKAMALLRITISINLTLILFWYITLFGVGLLLMRNDPAPISYKVTFSVFAIYVLVSSYYSLFTRSWTTLTLKDDNNNADTKTIIERSRTTMIFMLAGIFAASIMIITGYVIPARNKKPVVLQDAASP